MTSLQINWFRDLLIEFNEPAFVIRANAPEFSLVASNYERYPGLLSAAKPVNIPALANIFGIPEQGQSGRLVFEAGLCECLNTKRIIWISGCQVLQDPSVSTMARSLWWQLEVRPIITHGSSIDYLLIAGHLMSEYQA